MALYIKRIERKEKIRKLKKDLSIYFGFMLFYLKARYSPFIDFSKEIRNLTHEQLENRFSEIRYYQNDYNDKYESLKTLHEFYMKENGLNISYNSHSFYGVFKMLKSDLYDYEDIEISIEKEIHENYTEQYILIKRKEV